MHINYIPKTPEEEIELSKDLTRGAQFEYELHQSDYIIIKISEAKALGNDTKASELVAKHRTEIEKRQLLRNGINAIKDHWEK